MKMAVKRKKKRGSFLTALGYFSFLLFLIVFGAIALAYVNRDNLLLQYVRQQGPQKFGLEALQIEEIVTRPLGQISIELHGLVLQATKTSPVIRADKVVLATPKNIFEAYRMTIVPEPLELKVQLVGFNVQATTPDAAPAPETPSATSPASPLPSLPFPVDIMAELRDSSLELGSVAKPTRLTKLNGLVHLAVSMKADNSALNVANDAQLVLNLGIGNQQLPLRLDWNLTAAPLMNDLSNFTAQLRSLNLSLLGVKLKSEGSVKWPEKTFSLSASGSTPDLSVIPLSKAESEALGLDGRLQGSADVSVNVAGKLDGVVTSDGMIKLKDAVLPFAISRETPKRVIVKGPVEVDLELPLKLTYDMAKKSLSSLDIQLATFQTDLTKADVRVEGVLNKAPQTGLTLKGQVTSQGETFDVSSLEAHLANLSVTAKGQLSLEPKRHSKIDISATLPNLTGWPLLLPILGTIEGGATTRAADVNKAKGSFSVKAHIETPLAEPETIKTDTKVTLDQFDATDVEFPLNIRNDAEKHLINGVVRGSLSAAGSLQTTADENKPYVWNLKKAQGTLDLKDLGITWADVFTKAKALDMGISFLLATPSASLGAAAAKANSDVRVRADKFELRFRDSTASMTGTFAQEESGNIVIDSNISTKSALSQIYELFPAARAVRAKIPTGTVTAAVKVSGTYKPKLGPSGSPLVADGRIGLKTPKAVLLEIEAKSGVPVAAAKKEEQTDDKDSIFHWPLFAKSNLIFDVQIDAITMHASELRTVNTLATLKDGNLKGSLGIGNAFGGPVKLTSFAISDLDKKPMSQWKFTSSGTFQAINLSMLGEFMDPEWKSLVAGLASGTISLETLPLSPLSMADTSTASGSLNVKQGRLSTVALDQFVNQKLAEYPLIAKLSGATPKIATQAVNLTLASAFTFAKGRLSLKDLKAVTPERNELQLNGWLQKDFTTELIGQAFLADTPIGGSIRQANSDKSGRLVVPIKISGSLKSPNLAIAEDALSAMTKKTVDSETNKLKNTVKDKAVDAIKEELKKRGLGF